MAGRTIHWKEFCCYAFLLVAASLVSQSHSIQTWWSVGVTDCGKRIQTVNSSCPNCAGLRQRQWFTEAQEEQCREDQAIRDSLAKGARAAIIDCQRRFNESRWNCSTLYGDHLFGAFVANSQTRETGVLNAYFTASAISAIADDCHNQRISSCPCVILQPRTEDSDGNVVFESCKADFASAATLFRSFATDQIDTTTFQGMVDKHNVHFGEHLVNKELKTCRCHGISGTCTVQTCYRRVPTIEEVGEQLKQKYDGAVHVNVSAGEIVNVNPNRDPPQDDDIIYKDNSPDFCQENLEIGTTGVANRLCNPNSNHPNACSSTCCNRGHYPKTKTVGVEECSFIYCCEIVCNIVRNDTFTEYRCN